MGVSQGGRESRGWIRDRNSGVNQGGRCDCESRGRSETRNLGVNQGGCESRSRSETEKKLGVNQGVGQRQKKDRCESRWV